MGFGQSKFNLLRPFTLNPVATCRPSIWKAYFWSNTAPLQLRWQNAQQTYQAECEVSRLDASTGQVACEMPANIPTTTLFAIMRCLRKTRAQLISIVGP